MTEQQRLEWCGPGMSWPPPGEEELPSVNQGSLALDTLISGFQKCKTMFFSVPSLLCFVMLPKEINTQLSSRRCPSDPLRQRQPWTGSRVNAALGLIACEKTRLWIEAPGLFLAGPSLCLSYRGTSRGRESAGKRKQVKTIAGRISVT